MSNKGKYKSLATLKIVLILLLVIIETAVFSLGYYVGQRSNDLPQEIDTKTTVAEQNLQTIPTEETAPETLPQADEKSATVDELMENMSLSDMVYQMMFVTPESLTGVGVAVQAGDATKAAIEAKPVGGIIYFSQNFTSRSQTLQMIENTQSFSKIPLFIGVDEEGGRVSRLGSISEMGTTLQPPMQDIGKTNDVQNAYNVGVTLGDELKELGFNVDFAPCADVIVNEKNTEIGDRSFGTDPQTVSNMVFAVVDGIQSNGVSATLKHFPGHGSTAVDSHTGYSESTRTLEQLRNCEFLPFKAGIDADFVMVSHMTLPNVDENKLPSTLSEKIITDLLKGELGYSGIVITDSFSMGAITDNYNSGEAAVMAINAGVDMILMPKDMEAAHDAIVQAVENGEISQERIEESVRKILTLKAEKQML